VRFPSRRKRQEVCAHKPGEALDLELSSLKVIGFRQRSVLKVNASIRKLLSTIEAHLVSPARNREWTAHVAMRAAEEPLEDSLYLKFQNLFPSNLLSVFGSLSSQTYIEP
jgi:hypothetical protein